MNDEIDKNTDIGEVIFEFVPFGASIKVSAIHVSSKTEVSIMGPDNAPRAALERTALAKLRYVLNKNKAGSSGPGIVC